MAFLVLALSFFPCSDGFSSVNSTAKESVITKNAESTEQHTHQDACTPFCTCSCCASVVTGRVSVFETPFNLPLSKKQTGYFPSSICDISLPVWQPPQL